MKIRNQQKRCVRPVRKRAQHVASDTLSSPGPSKAPRKDSNRTIEATGERAEVASSSIDNWKPDKDEFLLEDIGYPIQENATKGKYDQLSINTSEGLPLKKDQVPKLKEYVAANNREFVKKGWLKFKIDGYKEPTEQFMKTYNGLKMGKNLYGAPVSAKVLELFKLKDGLHFTRYHDIKSSLKKLPCLSKVPFDEISETLANSFGGSHPVAVTRSFFNVIEKLPINKLRKGRGLLIPYPVIEGDANLGDDVVRSNTDLNNLDSPLMDLEKNPDGSVPDHRGIVNCMTYLGLPASFFVTHIEDGPALGSVNVVLVGGVKCWLFVASRFFNKVRKALIKDLKSLNLPKSDHLLTNDFRCIFQHKNLILGPEFYKRHNIPFTLVHQNAGEIMVIGSKVLHCGLNCALNACKACNAIFSDFHFSYCDDFKQCDCPVNVEDDRTDRNVFKPNGERVNPLENPVYPNGRVTKTGRYFAHQEDIEALLEGSEELLEKVHNREPDQPQPSTKKSRYEYREDKKWTCENCLKQFTKKRGLNEHIKQATCNKYGMCRREGCDMKFDRKERFEKHERWHKEQDEKQGFETPFKKIKQPSKNQGGNMSESIDNSSLQSAPNSTNTSARNDDSASVIGLNEVSEGDKDPANSTTTQDTSESSSESAESDEEPELSPSGRPPFGVMSNRYRKVNTHVVKNSSKKSGVLQVKKRRPSTRENLDPPLEIEIAAPLPNEGQDGILFRTEPSYNRPSASLIPVVIPKPN